MLAGEVLAGDTIVIGMGLYHFGVPSTVKAWFDWIVVRESPRMIRLDLGAAEDESLANAHAAIDALFAPSGVPA